MSRPLLLDLFSGAGGAARGYQMAGFEVVGVDIKPQPRYVGSGFLQADALDVLSVLLAGGHPLFGSQYYGLDDFAAIHASPPCQGYSIMNNLPWLKGREYPLLILPTMELLEATGKPYVLENVMGARHGAKGLKKRGLEAHGLKAGYLCGRMFGLPFYRHRLFATNWFWLAPGHPKHQGHHPSRKGDDDRGRGIAEQGLSKISDWAGPHGHRSNPTERNNRHIGIPQVYQLSAQEGTMTLTHAPKARVSVAAEIMEVTWMVRDEVSQSIPPAFTRYIGQQLMGAIRAAL